MFDRVLNKRLNQSTAFENFSALTTVNIMSSNSG